MLYRTLNGENIKLIIMSIKELSKECPWAKSLKCFIDYFSERLESAKRAAGANTRFSIFELA